MRWRRCDIECFGAFSWQLHHTKYTVRWRLAGRGTRWKSGWDNCRPSKSDCRRWNIQILHFNWRSKGNSKTIRFEVTKFQFFVSFFLRPKQFHIAINNQSYCTYAYRLSIDKIRVLQLKNDLQFVTQVDQRTAFPFLFPPVQFDDPRNAFSNDYPRPFKSGKTRFDWFFAFLFLTLCRSIAGHIIVITAIPYGNASGWFLLRFTDSASKRQALHFSARFDPHFVVVRTNMSENSV